MKFELLLMHIFCTTGIWFMYDDDSETTYQSVNHKFINQALIHGNILKYNLFSSFQCLVSLIGNANEKFRRTEVKPQQPWMMYTVRYWALLSHLKCHVCCITWVPCLKSHTITLLIYWLVILKFCSRFTAILNILYCIFFSLPYTQYHWSQWQLCQR